MSKAKDLQQLIKTLVGSNPSPAQKKSYYFSFAFKLYEAGEKADAKNYLEEYLAIKTQDVKGYNLLGQIYEELSSPNDAIKAYNRSLSIDDTQIRLMLKLSSLYLQVKNIAEANFWLDRAETKANNDEKAEIIQNRIEILKLSNASKVFEQAAAGLVHYPKHLGINIQYLEALEARESYFSIFQHFEKCNRYFETNIRWWEWGLHFLSRLIQKHKEKQQVDAMDEDSEQTVQMHEIVLAWMHFADRYTKLFIDSNFYTLSMVKCKEFEDLVRSARENPPAQLDEDDEQYWTYAIDEYAARVDQHYASTFIREASQTTSSEEQTNALREAFARLNKCFNNFSAESKMSTLQRRSEVGKQLWSLINTYKGHLDADQLAAFDVDGLLNSTKSLDLQILTSTPEYADNIDSVVRVCGFYHENKLHGVIEEIFNTLFGVDLPKIDTNIYREMSSPHVVDFITYFYVTLLTPATNANDPLWRDSRKAIRILSSKKKLDAPWTKHEDLPSVTSIAHWIDKIRIGPSDNPSLYFLTKLYSSRCIEPETELQKEFAPVYEKYTINLGKKLVKQLRQLLETRVNNTIVQSDKQAMLDDARNILETLAKRALKINDYTKAMACVNNLGTSSSYLLLIELSLSQFQSSQRKEFLQRAEQYLKRSSDFSFTKEEEHKKLEQLKNELHALSGDSMELENTNLTPMTPGTPSVYDTQPFISPAVDMTPTASAKRRREQQLSDLKKLRSEALQLSSSKGSATPSTPSTPSMFNMPPKKHESPPPARKLDFGGDQISTPETKPASQTNLFGNNTNVVPAAAAKPTAPTPATLPTPNRIQFITTPTVPVVNTPPANKPSVPTAVIKTDVPIPSPPKQSYKDNDRDDDSNDESKPQKKKRQLSDTDLDPQKKASLISATTNFPPIPTKIVSPNIVQPKTSPAKPSRAELMRNAQTFDFGAPSVGVAPTPGPSSTASPFGFGPAPTTDNKPGGSTSTAAPFGFGLPATDNKAANTTTASPFGFGAPSTDKTPAFGFGTPSATASPFSFGPAPTPSTGDKPKDQTPSVPSAGNFAFDFNSGPKTTAKPEEKKNESAGQMSFTFDNKPADKTQQSPFAFAPSKPATEEKKPSAVTTLVDNSSPFNFNNNKPGGAPQSFDFGGAKPANQSTSQSILGGSVKSEMSASELMGSDRSVGSTGWREERGSHFGSERNELFKETISPSSSQRSEDQDPSEEKSHETDSEHEEDEEAEEHEESEESYHSDDSDGWFTGPAPTKAKPHDDQPLASTPIKAENKPQPAAAPSKTNPTPQFGFGTAPPSFGVQDKPKEEKKAEIPSISFGSPTNKAKEEKRPESPAPVFSFSPRQLDKTEEKKPESGFGFGLGSPTFTFGGPKTPELPAAPSPKLSFESFTPKLEPKQPGEEGEGPFKGVPAFSLGGKPTEAKPTENKPEEKKSEEKPSSATTFSFSGFGAPARDKPKAEEKPEEKKAETGFGFGVPSFSFGQEAKSDASEPKKDATTPAFGFGFGTSEKPKEEKPEEKKSDNNNTSSTSFGFGFGATPSFGATSTPSFNFGQPSKPDASETKTEEPKAETSSEVVGPEESNTNEPSHDDTIDSEEDSEDENKPEDEDKSEEPVKTEEKPKDETKSEEAATVKTEEKPKEETKTEETKTEEKPKDETKTEEKKADTPSTSFGFGFGTPSFGANAPSFSFGQPITEPKREEKKTEETKPQESTEAPKFDLQAMGAATFKFGQTEEKKEAAPTTDKKPETPSTNFNFGFGGTPSFGTATPSFSFGQPSEEKKSEAEKPEEKKTEEAKTGPSTSFGFGFGGIPSFGTTPSFSFGQTTAESKPAEEKKPEEEVKNEPKSDEEKKSEETKTGPSTGFGFGFGGTPSFGANAPSFSFGQPTTEPKPEEKKTEETKPQEATTSGTEAPKFDLSAMGAATFKFGQTEEKKPDEAPPKSGFGFSFGGGLLEKDKAAQDKPSKHLKDPMKPIPDDSDDDDSDSDDDTPVKSKTTSASNTPSISFAPSSFSFAPSSFSVPSSSSDATKSTGEEQPKFEFTVQFGEASMTKRLGSEYGLADNKMSAANTNNNNNNDLAGSGSSFSFGDKIFGQVSTAPLTTFSSLTKSDDKTEGKKDDDKAETSETKSESKDEKSTEAQTKDDKQETDELKHEDKEDKTEQSEAKDDKEELEEPSVNDSVVSESEESQSVNQSVNESVSESVNTTVEASHDEGSDSDPASASDDDVHEGEANVTDTINEKHTTTLSHFQRASGPKNRRKPSHPPAVEKKEEDEPKDEHEPTETSVDEQEPKDEPEEQEPSPAKPKLGFGFALPGMAPGVDLRSVLKKKNQPEDKPTDQSAVEDKTEASNNNQEAESADEPKHESTVEDKPKQTEEEKSSVEDSAVESVPSDVPSLVSDSHVEDSLNKDVSDLVRSEESKGELSVSVLEGSNLSVESTGWKQVERGSHFGSEHDNPLFASTLMSPPDSMVSSQIDEVKDDEKPEEKSAEEQKQDDVKPVEPVQESKSDEKAQDEAKAEDKSVVEEKKEEQKPFAFNFPNPNTSSDATAAPKEKLSFDFTGFSNTPSFGFGAPKQDSTTPSTGFGFGFSGTPSFSFGQDKPKEETKTEEKKVDTPSTGFGFGFGTPSFGTTPSFSFGQNETKKEEPTKQGEKNEAPTQQFDLSAMGAATFKFGQTEEKKSEPALTPGFNFGFGNTSTNTASPFSMNFGGALGAPSTQQPKPSTQDKPKKKSANPIPDDSDDDDSDSDDDTPVKSKTTNTSNTPSISFAPSSFSFAPSSFSVPSSSSDATKNTREEQPKFEFTVQFGEASMTKRLGSEYGLSDNKMSATNTNNNLASSGTGFGFGSSDKIFGQSSTTPLTTFSALNKSEDKEKSDQDNNKDDNERKPE